MEGVYTKTYREDVDKVLRLIEDPESSDKTIAAAYNMYGRVLNEMGLKEDVRKYILASREVREIRGGISDKLSKIDKKISSRKEKEEAEK